MFSFEDVDSMLRILAVLEYLDIHVTFEDSIVYRRITGALTKKTLKVGPDGLSFKAGDYSFGVSGDRQVRGMFATPFTYEGFSLTGDQR